MDIFSQKYKEVLDTILELKNEHGLTDLALAKNLNLNLGVVDNWKRGKSKSYLKIIPQIAKYFDVSTDYLLGVEPKISLTNTKKDDFIGIETKERLEKNETSTEKEMLTEDKAISMIEQTLINAGIVKNGESLNDVQLLILEEFITNNASMLKKLMDTGK